MDNCCNTLPAEPEQAKADTIGFNQTTLSGTWYAPKPFAPSVPNTCPHCGYCPTCGRKYNDWGWWKYPQVWC